MYIVTRYFTDAQDNSYAYHAGDKYPREGLNVSEQRINDLMSGNNFQRISLITRVPDVPEKKVKEVKDEKETTWSADEINSMPYLKLKSVAKQNGIDVEDKKGAELKKELIEKLGL